MESNSPVIHQTAQMSESNPSVQVIDQNAQMSESNSSASYSPDCANVPVHFLYHIFKFQSEKNIILCDP